MSEENQNKELETQPQVSPAPTIAEAEVNTDSNDSANTDSVTDSIAGNNAEDISVKITEKLAEGIPEETSVNTAQRNSEELIESSQSISEVGAETTLAPHEALDMSEADKPSEITQMDEPLEIIEPENPLPDIKFSDLDDITKVALEGAGWSSLLPVQSKTIPYMNAGRDMLIQSKTGSGKTGAFLIPLFQIIEESHEYPQALILAPTRELALQIKTECDRIQGDRNIKSVALYGGVKYQPQMDALRDGVHLVIATPGRLMDHLAQGNLDFNDLRDLILDEADEMLSMGFYEDMKKIKKMYLPEQYCTTMFSATFTESIKTLSREFQAANAGFLSLSFDKISTDALAHSYMVVDPMEKDKTITNILDTEDPESCIIFCNMKRDVEYLSDYLKKFGYEPGILSGDVSQAQRQRTLKKYRNKTLKILIATDVAARGIDISHVTHVLLHDHPEDSEVYIHRAGRTARAGRKGKAISIVTPVEELALKRTANQFSIKFEKVNPPTEAEASAKLVEVLKVHLKDEQRKLKIAYQNQMPRFANMVKAIQDDEESELLGMLLHRYYLNLHKDQFDPEEVDEENPDELSDLDPKEHKKKFKDKGRHGGGGRHRRR